MPDYTNLTARLKALPLFASLNERELDLVAGWVEHVTFQQGAIIFKQGDPSDKFYVIESGRVGVTVHDETGAEAWLSRLEGGDFFGEAGLLKAEKRNATVTALAETSVFAFDEDGFQRLLQRFPAIKKQLTSKARVRTGGGWKHFGWELDDEVTLLVARRHPIALIKAIPAVLGETIILLVLLALVPLAPGLLHQALFVLSLVALVIWVLSIAWHIVDWSNDFLIVTDKRVVHIERVLFISEVRSEIPMDAVQDVVLSRKSPLATWFNYAGLRIQTAGGGGHITFDFLRNPEAVQQQILQQRRRVTTEKRSTTEAAIRYELLKAISPPGAPLPPPPPAPYMLSPIPTQEPPRTLGQRLGEIFQMRIEHQGEIIWRKHWGILFKQLFKPLLLITAGFVLIGLERKWLDYPWLEIVSLVVPFIGLLWFAWEWEDWRNDLYILTPTNIIDIERLPLRLREKRREGGLDRIQDVQVVVPNFWANLFNIGNVRIKTAAAEGDFSFDSVYNPRSVQRAIFHQLARYRRQQELQQRQRQFEDMAQWFAIYTQVTGQTARPPAEQAAKE